MATKIDEFPRYEPLLSPEHAKEVLALATAAITVLVPVVLALPVWHPRSWVNALALAAVWGDLLLLGLGIFHVAWAMNDSREYHDCEELERRSRLGRDFDIQKIWRRMQHYDSVAWIHEYRGTELCKMGLFGALGIMLILPLALSL
jgi:hypothetical protein